MKNPLYKDKVFLILLFLAITVFLLSLFNAGLDAYSKYDFNLFGGVEAWKKAYEHYAIPIALGAGIFALYALFTSMHLLAVQSQQQVDARRLNEFTIYFKQREEFDKKFRPWLEEWIVSTTSQQLTRWNSFFLDFNWKDYDRKNYKDEYTENRSKEFAIALYDFCFGVGRNIELSGDFLSVMSRLEYFLLGMDVDPSEEAQSAFNKEMHDLVVAAGLGELQSFFRDDWFSENEKFSHALTIFRLFCEIEIFVAMPRKFLNIPVVGKNIHQMNHGMVHGSNVTKGESHKSKGYRERRHPSLSSRLLGGGNHCPIPYGDDGYLIGDPRRPRADQGSSATP